MQKYYQLNPYRVNIHKTIRENAELIDTYIDTYKTHTSSHTRRLPEFALRYILVKTSVDKNRNPNPQPHPMWMINFLDHHLTTGRPPLDIPSSKTIYFPLSKRPDRVFMYLRDRELSNVSFL